MTDTDMTYEFKSVRTIRGAESRSMSKWQKLGWEFVAQDEGKLRTTLTFRRQNPKRRLRGLVFAGGAAALLFIAIGIGIVTGDDNDTDNATPPAGQPPVTDVMESQLSESPTPTESAAILEPTKQEVWVANYNTNRGAYVAAVATALALRPGKVDAPTGALNACRLMDSKQPLDKRVGQARRSFTGTSGPTYDEALAAISATANSICPEFVSFHEKQTAERAKALRAAEKRRKERERRRKEAAAARAAQEEAEAAEKLAEQEYAYYANCTEVEAAGAAPIYSGDPGYSRDLDRDGDGVACEQ